MADSVDQGRRIFFLQLAGLIGTSAMLFSGCSGLMPTENQTEEDSSFRQRNDPRDLRSQRFSLREILDSHFGGAWQPWDCQGIAGDGIWQVQAGLFEIDQGLCHIRRNGQVMAGGQSAFNLDNLFFWSGETISLASIGGQPYWEWQIPWLPRTFPAILD